MCIDFVVLPCVRLVCPFCPLCSALCGLILPLCLVVGLILSFWPCMVWCYCLPWCSLMLWLYCLVWSEFACGSVCLALFLLKILIFGVSIFIFFIPFTPFYHFLHPFHTFLYLLTPFYTPFSLFSSTVGCILHVCRFEGSGKNGRKNMYMPAAG